MEALERAGLGRANFVLHFHGFHDEEPLTGFDFFAGLDEDADDFAGHGSYDLLAAFEIEGAAATATPRAGIGDFGGEFLQIRLKLEETAGRLHDVDFEGLAFEKDGKSVGIDFDDAHVERLAVQRNFPLIGVAFEFDDAEFSAGGAGEMDFKFRFHGRRSNCWRRPSCFHREEEGSLLEEAGGLERLSP